MMEKMNSSNKVTVQVSVTNIEEMVDKAERLVSLLKEAKTLADELASTDYELLSEIDI